MSGLDCWVKGEASILAEHGVALLQSLKTTTEIISSSLGHQEHHRILPLRLDDCCSLLSGWVLFLELPQLAP